MNYISIPNELEPKKAAYRYSNTVRGCENSLCMFIKIVEKSGTAKLLKEKLSTPFYVIEVFDKISATLFFAVSDSSMLQRIISILRFFRLRYIIFIFPYPPLSSYPSGLFFFFFINIYIRRTFV